MIANQYNAIKTIFYCDFASLYISLIMKQNDKWLFLFALKLLNIFIQQLEFRSIPTSNLIIKCITMEY